MPETKMQFPDSVEKKLLRSNFVSSYFFIKKMVEDGLRSLGVSESFFTAKLLSFFVLIVSFSILKLISPQFKPQKSTFEVT